MKRIAFWRRAALWAALASSGCATTRIDRHIAERQHLERRIVSLAAALDTLRLAHDSLRLDTSRLQFELLDRDQELRTLRLELERLKEIDLKPKRRLPSP